MQLRNNSIQQYAAMQGLLLSNEKGQGQKQMEIGVLLNKFFQILKRYALLMISLALVGGLAGYLITAFFITPKYQASTTMIVNNSQQATGTLTTSDYNAATHLVDTYAVIIKSDTVLNPVISQLSLDMPYEARAAQIDVSPVNNTQLMQVSMVHPNGEYARKIVEKISQIAPQLIEDRVAGSCKIISQARTSSKPVTPNLKWNLLLSVFSGLAVAAIIIFIRESMDNTVNTEEQLAEITDSIVIGVIPLEGGRRHGK